MKILLAGDAPVRSTSPYNTLVVSGFEECIHPTTWFANATIESPGGISSRVLCGSRRLLHYRRITAKDDAGHVLVTTPALQPPDGNWSLLLVNRDPSNAHRVRIVFETLDGRPVTKM